MSAVFCSSRVREEILGAHSLRHLRSLYENGNGRNFALQGDLDLDPNTVILVHYLTGVTLVRASPRTWSARMSVRMRGSVVTGVHFRNVPITTLGSRVGKCIQGRPARAAAHNSAQFIHSCDVCRLPLDTTEGPGV